MIIHDYGTWYHIQVKGYKHDPKLISYILLNSTWIKANKYTTWQYLDNAYQELVAKSDTLYSTDKYIYKYTNGRSHLWNHTYDAERDFNTIQKIKAALEKEL